MGHIATRNRSVQTFSARRHDEVGERALVAAVLEDAIELALERRKDANNPALYDEARSYIASNRTHVMSFIWCCELLNINPQYVRRYVRERVALLYSERLVTAQHVIEQQQARRRTATSAVPRRRRRRRRRAA